MATLFLKPPQFCDTTPRMKFTPLCLLLAALAAHGETIKIVSSLPRTGSANAQTTTMVNGIKLAIEDAAGKLYAFATTTCLIKRAGRD